jgi:hypothetical protein
MLSLHWSCSRSAVRTALCEKDENYVQRQFDRHNNTCTGEDECYLNLLEQILIRKVHFETTGRECDEITQLSVVKG